MKKNILIGIVVIIILALLFILFGKDDEGIPPSEQQELASENFNIEDFPETADMLKDSPPPSSFSLIDSDLENSEITLDQMYAYKLVDMFDSSLLKEKYKSDTQVRLQGDTILMSIQEDFDSLTPKTQELIQPMLLPFSNEDSFFYHDSYEFRQQIISELAKL